MHNYFTGKNICITWWTWSWWQELTRQLVWYHPAKIIIVSRGEHKQVEMKRMFHEYKNISYIIGDVRDVERMIAVTKWVDILFHLAALKHVPVCEENPYESVQTNIIGIQNIITAAIQNKIKKVIDVSTDKAVDPFNIYGTCKAVWEKMIIAANRETKDTDFVCVRWGNVLGTNWSVVPLFIEQIKKTNKVTITDPTMTRFLMRLPEAIWLLIKASIDSVWWEVVVMNMPWITVENIANALIQTFGKGNTEKIIIGSRPWEKKHELLISQYESNKCFVIDENYYVILPMIETYRKYEKYLQLEKFHHEYFGSNNTTLLTADEFVEMLKLDGWFNDMLNKESIHELEKLSKEELLDFFRLTYGMK
jgi:UDP-N-acetylglucosamine 4,6-dehydratase/5-epimerase